MKIFKALTLTALCLSTGLHAASTTYVNNAEYKSQSDGFIQALKFEEEGERRVIKFCDYYKSNNSVENCYIMGPDEGLTESEFTEKINDAVTSTVVNGVVDVVVPVALALASAKIANTIGKARALKDGKIIQQAETAGLNLSRQVFKNTVVVSSIASIAKALMFDHGESDRKVWTNLKMKSNPRSIELSGTDQFRGINEDIAEIQNKLTRALD